jgi:hypothetical protein
MAENATQGSQGTQGAKDGQDRKDVQGKIAPDQAGAGIPGAAATQSNARATSQAAQTGSQAGQIPGRSADDKRGGSTDTDKDSE